ncbi:MAG: pilin [Patescibacteria group bacterium]
MFKFQKIFLICCVIFALASLLTPLFSQAAPSDALEKLKSVGGEAYGVGAEEPRSLPEIIGGIIQTALSILGIVAALLIIYAGYIWMTARGKEERVTKAKETLEAAIIGLIIIMAAYAITYFVVDRLMQASSTPTVAP